MKYIKKISIIFILAIIMIISFTFIAIASPNDNEQSINDTSTKTFTRLEGSGRYATMKKIVSEEFAYDSNLTHKPCVLARGDDYPDALAATALAGLFEGAIVLTPSNANALPDDTKAALTQLQPSDIWVPGGSISNKLLQDAKNLTGANLHEPIKGSGRTETSLKIYKTGVTESFANSWSDTAILTYSYGYADALSIAPLAYKMHFPIFLTDSNKNLTSDAKNAIKNGGFTKAIILGSTGAVSSKAESDLVEVLGITNVTRLGGSGRIATSAIISDYCVTHYGLSYEHLCVARGDDFPDALSMGPLCGKANSALMLSYPDKEYYDVLSQTQNNNAAMGTCYVAGGTSSISSRVFNQLQDAISTPADCGYLCFMAPEGTASLKLDNKSTQYLNFQFCTGNPAQSSNWSAQETISPGGRSDKSIAKNQKLYIRGVANNKLGGSDYNLNACFKFKITGKLICSGNVGSLLKYDDINTTLSEYCFANLFSDNDGLLTAPKLNSTTSSKACFYNMFTGCKSLTIAPFIATTTVSENSFANMFANCESLITAPKLPATNLAKSCYSKMFYNCMSLAVAPNLSSIILDDGCYSEMFALCTSMSKAPDVLPADSLTPYCYDRMFYKCWNLTAAPELPAQILEEGCYLEMFSHCSSLKYIKVHFLLWDEHPKDFPAPAFYETTNWLLSVAEKGTFVCTSTLDRNQRGESYIPGGWTIKLA
ncbi:MAG: cell wall-binding repeat-containing protein [Coriobacteriales bacterium]|nr:cell wall-binding repeat-containing protein [Coriobacteriales bacterium]